MFLESRLFKIHQAPEERHSCRFDLLMAGNISLLWSSDHRIRYCGYKHSAPTELVRRLVASMLNCVSVIIKVQQRLNTRTVSTPRTHGDSFAS